MNFHELNGNNILHEPLKRHVAFKLRISDLFRGNIIVNDRFRCVEIGDKKIIRVNIIANVIDKFFSQGETVYAGITLDDASGQIRVKSFGEDTSKLNKVDIGDTVKVIGVLRYFNNELYILPEILIKVDSKWLVVRKLELSKGNEKLEKQEYYMYENNKNREKIGAYIESEELKNKIREKILEILKKNEEGINVDKIIIDLEFDVDKINSVITEMLENAEIYEPQPGRIRLL